MSAMTDEKKAYKIGGSWLLEDHGTAAVFTPEELTSDDRDLIASVDEFVQGEVVPNMEQIEQGDHDTVVRILKKGGELGMLSTEVPEEYGGMNLKKTVASAIAEKIGVNGGFMVSVGAHTGIGTMPITYFGNKEQKAKYLPKLATGELLAAYALSETSSGSDALNARCRATLSECGKFYILNGNKMWISNAGFADVFVVFAKIDGKEFTGFIVEKEYEGVSTGAEERKMGIKSSSTRMLNLDDVKVPVENVLGEIGQGHKIAFNILNVGRYKLGSGCIGTAKYALGVSTKYAKERQAFGKSISEFGLIRQKLAEMSIRTFAAESMNFRTAGLIDQILDNVDYEQEGHEETVLRGIREYAMECAMAKVFCTEVLDYVVDEGVQIHGGYGFSREYEIERLYRDSRINRIFEGTNEINRLLTVDMLIKKAMKGELPLMQKGMELMNELMGMPSFDFDEDERWLADEHKIVENAKKISLFIAGAGFQKFMEKIEEQQELLGMAADLFIETYVMESMLLRTLKTAEREGQESAALQATMTRVYLHDAMERMAMIAKTALACIEEGDTLLTMNAALRRLIKHPALNTVAMRREISDAVVAKEGYIL